eukprot:CAMPEP_0184036764 /NCGR_PEP_ID=MMETSP0955-20130417/34571_1 /TAXON_ID=627963 /ORGANISM="Aplanochytrium sp, Strain PBS07" /LENGTH=246 /DNA_ID=CAMNT_0026324559 /DNA_START=49 /DNA_END=786 /DNA_ORIENTATION=-
MTAKPAASELQLNSKKRKSTKSLKPPLSCRRKKRFASSRYRGVCWLKKRQTWRARIEVDGKREHLGYFRSEIDAALAFDARAKTAFGDNCVMLNFPDKKMTEESLLTNEVTKDLVSPPLNLLQLNRNDILPAGNLLCLEKSSAALSGVNVFNSSMATNVIKQLPPYPLKAPPVQSGAVYSTISGEWLAYVTMNGKPLSVGNYSSEYMALQAASRATLATHSTAPMANMPAQISFTEPNKSLNGFNC